MKRFFYLFCLAVVSSCSTYEDELYLSLVPPGVMTDKIDLDMRAGIVNNSSREKTVSVSIYLNEVSEESLICETSLTLEPLKSDYARTLLPTNGLDGENKVIVVTDDGVHEMIREESFTVIPSEIRSTEMIEGAWIGIYHWSEQEGLHWNKDIKDMTEENWREMVRAMHSIGMNTVVIQEVFRNQEYVGCHDLTMENYAGKSFYPSSLYPGRMDIACEDPLEAILSEADILDMDVFMGVGMYAWFDFTPTSLEWHKSVARELWDMYGNHDSFYGFYVSEECAGNLYNSEIEQQRIMMRKNEIVEFFKEFRAFTNSFAPGKPVMLATNSMGVPYGADTYPKLLKNIDILCPFGFARMPEDDLTGYEVAQLLQKFCDDAGSHLWFDLEAFLFNPDMSLYPRPIDQIIGDLTLLDNFEKILCYQFPGVFNSTEHMTRIVGEDRTIDLYEAYKKYYDNLINNPTN